MHPVAQQQVRELDGMVALAGKQASRRGEILNDLPDRISDVLIFVGSAPSGLCHPLSGYWAAIAALLTAYVGLVRVDFEPQADLISQSGTCQ
jgi:phosphatidylglycerophosphate synthase